MKIRQSENGGLAILDTANGVMRKLGCLPDPEPNKLPLFSTVYSGIPEKDWVEFDHEAEGWAPEVYDQGQHGSCVGHGAAGAFGMAWLITGGEGQRFSPCYIYSRINGGRDQGAIPSHALELLKNQGVCLESTVGPNKIYPSMYDKTKADAEATRFRVEEGYKLNSFREMMEAAQTQEFTVTFGIDLGRRFEPSSDGTIPPKSGNGGGHMMYVTGARKFGGIWYFKIRNSWGERWGIKGSCFMERSYFDDPFLDAFAIRAVRLDPQDPTNPGVIG